MINHLHDREKALGPFGLKGREAEWVALVCLHSGVFTRAQFCYYFDGAPRSRALRFVRNILERGLYTGAAVFGSGWSGKTSVCMRPFAEQILSWRAGNPQRRAAALGTAV